MARAARRRSELGRPGGGVGQGGRPKGESVYCHIRVRGHLDPSWSHRLGGLRIEHETAGTSLLRGLVPDQAALYGILLRINALGLPLLSLETSAEPRQEG